MDASRNSETPPAPLRVGVRELRSNLTKILRQARQGRSFLVMSRDTVLAELRPPSQLQRPQRQPGALRGKISMAEDFDMLPPDLQDAMENDEV